MGPSEFDDAPWLPVGSAAGADLPALVFGLYRQLARERAEAEARSRAEFAERGAAEQAWRRRLARAAAPLHRLRLCCESLRQALAAGEGGEDSQRLLKSLLEFYEQAVRAVGVEVESLDGRVLDAELAELVEVQAHVPGDVPDIQIRETVEPLVRVDGAVVLLAQVITEVPRAAG